METTHFFRVLSVFLMGWALSGFGLTHILKGTPPSATQKTAITAGVPLRLQLSLLDASDNTAVTSGFRVELSQCSLQRPYGGNAYSCQPIQDEAKNSITNNANRQSQYTNAEGLVTFTAAYPDKFTAPTTHFHIAVYDRFNVLIASTQFDFPATVYPTITAFYKAGGKNPVDILKEDPTANPPLLVTGNPNAGFSASRVIFIPANAAQTAQLDVEGGQQLSNLKNFPNPVVNATTFAFHLTETSEVAITVTDGTGTHVKRVFNDNLTAGAHEIEVDLGGLEKGIYFYRLEVSNSNGTFSEGKKLIKV